jgi:hypothetical protein
MSVLRQLLVGCAASFGCIATHSLFTVAVLSAARAALGARIASEKLHLIAVMIATVSVLMLAHFLEVLIWGLTYKAAGVAAPDVDAKYFAFVNYTTLGYGDILPVEAWRLIGPITAMNGVLLFGWSTAIIFEVLRTASPINIAAATD